MLEDTILEPSARARGVGNVCAISNKFGFMILTNGRLVVWPFAGNELLSNTDIFNFTEDNQKIKLY
jgi:hypothetical protein